MRSAATVALVMLLAGCSLDALNEPTRTTTTPDDIVVGDAGDGGDSPDLPVPTDTARDTSQEDARADTAIPDTDKGDTSEDVPALDAADTTDAGGGHPASICGAAPGQLFPPGAPWNQRVDQRGLAADSGQVVGWLAENHDSQSRFQIDFSISVLTADAQTPRRAFTPTEDHWASECDTAPVPLPEPGSVEGELGYACTNDGDCHLAVVAPSECRLYEMFRADVRDEFRGGCLAVWDVSRVYPATGRGEHCTSADAAGLPIAPLMFGPDDIVAGEIRHAIRFVLPNDKIRERIYVRPATHSTPATTGPAAAPPYGARLRLRADADLSELNPAARVVAVAMQRYGIILADAGNITFTALDDRYQASSWDAVGLGPHDLKSLDWSQFEVVDAGPGIRYTGDCDRDPVTE